MAQFRELAAFAKFGSDLDEATQRQLARGERLVELLKQKQYSPLEVIDQVIAIYAATKGYFDKIPVAKINETEIELMDMMKSKHAPLLSKISESKVIDDQSEGELKNILASFVENKG